LVGMAVHHQHPHVFVFIIGTLCIRVHVHCRHPPACSRSCLLSAPPPACLCLLSLWCGWCV
jgi:hypothetical protein